MGSLKFIKFCGHITIVHGVMGGLTELYYISGDRALIQSQSKNCPQKHGGFLPKICHFDVTVMAQTTDQTAIHK